MNCDRFDKGILLKRSMEVGEDLDKDSKEQINNDAKRCLINELAKHILKDYPECIELEYKKGILDIKFEGIFLHKKDVMDFVYCVLDEYEKI